MSKITYLDGIRLYRALVAGIRQVISKQEAINNINVYPVPDRDTGTNMAMTLNAILEGTYATHKSSAPSLLEQVADSALNGARGNSGAILAQFFQGLYEGAQDTDGKMSTQQFSVAVKRGVSLAYSALSKPKEGTILTIIQTFSDAVEKISTESPDADYFELLKGAVEQSNIALQKTTHQLQALEKANVVDAGAQGFIELLTGICDFIENGSIKGLETAAPADGSAFTHTALGTVSVDEKYRFCTECLVIGESIDQSNLREALDKIGDSLIVAGTTKKTKVHVHANDPAEVFSICREFGQLKGEKADDMIHQQHSINHKNTEVAILTDSGADIPSEWIRQFDIHVVPLLVNFGSECFIDKVTLNANEFFALLKAHQTPPTTSQPSFGDFARQYQYLGTHYNSVIAIHMPQRVSGTLTASKHAASKTPGSMITVIDALSTSGGEGLVVTYAAELAKAGKTHEEIVARVAEIIPSIQIYVALPDLSFVERGGRLSARKRRIAETLRLTPVVSFDKTGKVDKAGALFGKKQLGQKLAKFTKKRMKKDTSYRVLITHCAAEDEANQLKSSLQTLHPKLESIHIMHCGSAMAAHTGPGSVCVAFQPIMVEG